MTDKVIINASELEQLPAEILRVAMKAPVELAAVVERGAANIKNDWRQRWSGHPHIKRLPSAIGYDLTRMPFGASAEIGPDQDSVQGTLAHVIEDGSPTSAPIPGGRVAADIEAPKFEAAVVALVDRLLGL